MQIQQQNAAMQAQQLGVVQEPPQVPQEIQQQIDQIKMQMEPLQNILRKIKLHRQWHDLSRKRKEMGSMQIGGAQQMQGQPAASMQAQMQGQARSLQ